MRFSNEIKHITYIGGGYVGLVGAVSFAKKGIPTTIYDIDESVCQAINSGNPKGEDFLKYLNSDIKILISHALLKATNQWDRSTVGMNDIFIIAVPSEQDGEPYMDIVQDVFEKIITTDRPNVPTIIVESTVIPGTLDILMEKASEYNSYLPYNYMLAVAPRRDWFADKDKNVENLIRVVGGVNEKSTQRAVDILSKVSKNIKTTDYQTAELVKGLENSLLNVPVLYAHELTMAYPNHNIREALKLAATHWRIPEYHLNLGTAGRCVPLGTKYMSAGADTNIHLSISREVNNTNIEFRHFVSQFIHDYIENKYFETDKKDSSHLVLFLGLGYRKDFTDIGLSPALDMNDYFLDYSNYIETYCCDPLQSNEHIRELGFYAVGDDGKDIENNVDIFSQADCIILTTPHTVFMKYPHEDWRWKEGQLVIDPMGTWKGFQKKFKNMGVDYRIIGEPGWRKI